MNCNCNCNCNPYPLPIGDKGAAGKDGLTPYIGENGNWWIGNTDTGTPAQGDNGDAATIAVGETTTLLPGSPATVTNIGTSSTAIFKFGIPQGKDGEGGNLGITNAHVWMNTTAETVSIPHGEDIFGVGTPKGIGFYSVQGSNIADFVTAGAAIKVNSIGTYLVSFQFIVKDTQCKVCIRRKSACVDGGHIQLSNTDGNILVSGTIVYLVSPDDITNTNGVFAIANEDNVRPLIIDPKSFSWTVTQLNRTYNSTFINIPFN